MDSEQQAASPSVTESAQSMQGLTDGLQSVLSNPDLMAKLPQVMAMLRPMLENGNAVAGTEAKTETDPSVPTPPKVPTDHRAALLSALKPFLSDDRKHAVDAMLRISALGDVLRSL